MNCQDCASVLASELAMLSYSSQNNTIDSVADKGVLIYSKLRQLRGHMSVNKLNDHVEISQLADFTPPNPELTDTAHCEVGRIAVGVKPFGLELMTEWGAEGFLTKPLDLQRISTCSTSPVWNPHTKSYINLPDDH